MDKLRTTWATRARAIIAHRHVPATGLILAAALLLLAGLLTADARAQSDTGQAAAEPPIAFVTINLEAGHPLDPFLVSLNGGGDVDASTLSKGCSGFVNADPTVTVNWTGDADFVETFFYSDHDPVLVVQLPDGSFMCSDDANAQLLDPVVQIDNPLPGQYSIWVGSYAPNQLIPGLLVITRRPLVNIGTFSLEGLIDRDNIPEDLVKLEELRSSPLPLDALREQVNAQLAPGMETVVEAVTSAGSHPAFDIPMNDMLCNGFIEEAPNHVFEWAGDADNLRVFFEGNDDATLLVVTPEGEFLCNDDAAVGGNLNPMLDIPNPTDGTYLVFVGRINPDEEVTGQLTIAESSELIPAELETE